MKKKDFQLLDAGYQKDLKKNIAVREKAIRKEYENKIYVGTVSMQKKARKAQEKAMGQKIADMKKKISQDLGQIIFGEKGREHYAKLTAQENKAQTAFNKTSLKGKAKASFNKQEGLAKLKEKQQKDKDLKARKKAQLTKTTRATQIQKKTLSKQFSRASVTSQSKTKEIQSTKTQTVHDKRAEKAFGKAKAAPPPKFKGLSK